MEGKDFLSVFVGLLFIVVAVITIRGSWTTMSQDYTCSEENHTNVCIAEGVCAADVYVCEDAELPTLNVTYTLCTNASGVRVINATPSDGCGVEANIITADYNGPSAVEMALIGVALLLMVVAGVYLVYGSVKKK